MLETHKRVIYKVCYLYASDTEHLNDLYQDTVLNLWRAYPAFRGDSSLSTWIYRISLNTCISYLRKSKSQVEAITLPVNLEISDENDGASQASCTNCTG